MVLIFWILLNLWTYSVFILRTGFYTWNLHVLEIIVLNYGTLTVKHVAAHFGIISKSFTKSNSFRNYYHGIYHLLLFLYLSRTVGCCS